MSGGANLRRLVAGLVVAAAASVLGLFAAAGARAYVDMQHPTGPGPWPRDPNAWYACMQRQLHAKVPAHSTINVYPQQPLLFVERITEWSTPDARLVSNPHKADYVVRFVRVPAGPCEGYDVEARPS